MTQPHIQVLEGVLISFGLTPKQAKVYMAALQLGTSSVQQIAEKAQIERTNAYDAIQALIDRRLLSITTAGKKRLFVSEAPEMLSSILEEKHAQLEAALPELRALYNVSPTKPKIQFYPGAEGGKAVFETLLAEGKEGEINALVPLADLIKTLGQEYIVQTAERRAKQGTSLKVIRCRGKQINDLLPTDLAAKREVRLAPQGVIFSVATFIQNHKTIFLSMEGEVFGLMIESANIARAQRDTFSALWQQSEPVAG